MELRQIKYFLAVAEELHFRRAAEVVHVAQPALSQQIRHLEEELRVTLFERSNRKVLLTPAGKVFYERAKVLMENARAAMQEAQRVDRGEAGSLTLGFVSTAALDVIPAALKHFQTQAPSAQIVLKELGPDDQIDCLHRGQLDLGVLHAVLKDDDLRTQVLTRERFVAALPRTPEFTRMRRVDLRRLACETAILPIRHAAHGYYEFVLGAYSQAGVVPARILHTRLIQTGLMLVAGGLGVALVPESFSRNLQMKDLIYRPLLTHPPLLELIAVWRHDNASPLLARFIEELSTLDVPGPPKDLLDR
ncbi:LysR family transcriptional regulator [Geothrix sp. 21YS21S-4]|uniref:LysR family transcriptional regulator n=1 Tax=Geothrix sp. 21YS21S-4 TaxID=3068889 RepID=UPI0027B96FFE|nr:LysR substrate-binding domain-containing protein [Geothrix sp. 21YS21S-4]